MRRSRSAREASRPSAVEPGGARRKAFEIGALVIFASELGVLLGRIAASIETPWDLARLAPAALLGVLLTDLVSGVVHWLCDTFGHEGTPVLGRLLIAPFREHHRSPALITERGLLRVNHTNCVGIVIVLGAALWLTEPGREGSSFARVFLVGFACSVYLTNTIHRWAHLREPPAIACWVQRAGLAIAPSHHARHHVAGRGHYCITTGWLNPLLDRSGIFVALERVGRIRPGGDPRSLGR